MGGSTAGWSRGQEFGEGVRRLAPLWVGIAPFGMIYGVMAVECGLAPWQAQAMSSLVFAGSSQIVLCQLLAGNAPLVVIFLTVGVINLRHVLYSASLAPVLKSLPWWWKVSLAYFLTDEAYATTLGRMLRTDTGNAGRDAGGGVSADGREGRDFRHWYLLGGGVALWVCWQVSTLAGILLGRGIPPEWGLDFAIPLTFIAIVVPRVKSRADWAAVAVSGVAALVFATLPFKLSLIVATVLGVGAGVVLSRGKVVGA